MAMDLTMTAVEPYSRCTSSRRVDLRWYVVQTKPKQERRTEENFRAWGVETLLPLMRTTAAGAPGRVTCTAMFPSYLFVRIDYERMAGKVRFTRGVTRLLGTSEGATAVDDSIVGLIADRMDGAGVVDLHRRLTPGDRVRITTGPFRDLEGIFETTASAEDRVTLLLVAVQSPMRVTVKASAVERVAAPAAVGK
jgi:transcriptional antiterminator RfaH